ncbi:hypothetical protein StoSoilB20_19650 [Arthrobacter sp. StoSoilB20]|nr:hypothetical protein StoSoilB20_19650 [Arthrobacter sp. StoSoilB20]
MLTGGLLGLRNQAEGSDHLGLGASAPATYFPSAVALASSRDVLLVSRFGRAFEDDGVALGSGTNFKRSPLFAASGPGVGA